VSELRVPAGDDLIDWAKSAGALRAIGATQWADQLPALLGDILGGRRHGELDDWLEGVRALPVVPTRHCRLDVPAVTVGTRIEATAAQRTLIREGLQRLHPWRKGPFDLFGVHVDAEWRSDLKWARIAPHLASLRGRRVLDVGCGNGYYGWRLCGAGARLVVGVDPSQRYLVQYLAVRRLLSGTRADLPSFHFLPVRLEDLPAAPGCFDTVLSMGVIYHRRDPLAHLAALRDLLRPGGQLVLESLVIPGEGETVLRPAGRYARMTNVWAIPTVAQLCRWLVEAGLASVRLVGVASTAIAEQRRTDWMRFHSLADFLDPDDPARTIEGHPAPVRAACVATR
jgi:tRNA (mo5U34)-methyltransferase